MPMAGPVGHRELRIRIGPEDGHLARVPTPDARRPRRESRRRETGARTPPRQDCPSRSGRRSGSPRSRRSARHCPGRSGCAGSDRSANGPRRAFLESGHEGGAAPWWSPYDCTPLCGGLGLPTRKTHAGAMWLMFRTTAADLAGDSFGATQRFPPAPTDARETALRVDRRSHAAARTIARPMRGPARPARRRGWSAWRRAYPIRVATQEPGGPC